eukprot:TRINITY_DN5115_c0_g1_i1.p1 TRINITY_DN5115_c0_g1~~TRINITY_DN5115_c0_g1_i1.p1  ORF type:complete len:297 (+),score=22.92 TRINITY_DN5115_c0_g1_i1:148-1038(+)
MKEGSCRQLGAIVALLCVVASLQLVSARFEQEPYNAQVAQRNVLFSYSGYCGENVNSNWNCYWCNKIPDFKWVGDFGRHQSSGFGFVGYSPSNKSITVVFRGTDNLPGWITDAKFEQTPCWLNSKVMIHKGFQEDYRSMSGPIDQLVSKAFSLCGRSCKLYVTGHSLGAALATIGAVDLTARLHYNVTLYTFGSPRVGNVAFENWAFNQLPLGYWRMTWYRDPVPHLPPESFFSYTYHHLPREVWYNGHNYVMCNGSGEDPHCSDSIMLYNVLDHALYMNIDILDGVIHGCLYTDP